MSTTQDEIILVIKTKAEIIKLKHKFLITQHAKANKLIF